VLRVTITHANKVLAAPGLKIGEPRLEGFLRYWPLTAFRAAEFGCATVGRARNLLVPRWVSVLWVTEILSSNRQVGPDGKDKRQPSPTLGHTHSDVRTSAGLTAP